MEKDQNYLSPSFHRNLVVFWFSYPVNVFLFIYFFNKQCVGFGFYFLFNCGLLKKKKKLRAVVYFLNQMMENIILLILINNK